MTPVRRDEPPAMHDPASQRATASTRRFRVRFHNPGGQRGGRRPARIFSTSIAEVRDSAKIRPERRWAGAEQCHVRNAGCIVFAVFARPQRSQASTSSGLASGSTS